MQDTIAIQEQEKAIKITIRSETLKPIIDAIKKYDPTFDINRYDKENDISFEILQLLVERYQELLYDLIDDNVPLHNHDKAFTNTTDNVGTINLLDY